MKFNNLSEVLAYIEKKTNFQLGLYRLQDFLEKSNIDYSKQKFIHIAGTNGKGSTAYYLSNILIESGYKTGMFSSPSIESHNDRIRINNEFIDDQSIVDFVNDNYELIEKTELTMFEIDVIMALGYFSANNVEYVVLETGMGGRFDGTNVVEPILSIITNIGLDHTAYLGNTLAEVAYNKAGIIKENNYVLTAEKNDESLDVIKDYASKMNSEVILTSEAKISSRVPLVFDYKQYHNIELKTLADYQVLNATIVLDAVDLLNNIYNMNIKEDIVRNVFKTVTWNGRFEVMCNNPLVIIDGAHNVAGINQLINSIDKFDYNKTIMFSALADKDTSEMVGMLVNTNNEIIITEFEFYRAQKAELLKGNYDLEIALDYKDYIAKKISKMNSKDMLIITGSLYFITEVRNFLLKTLKS